MTDLKRQDTFLRHYVVQWGNDPLQILNQQNQGFNSLWEEQKQKLISLISALKNESTVLCCVQNFTQNITKICD